MGIYQGMPQETHKHIYLVENTLCAIYWPYDLAFSTLVKNAAPQNTFDIQQHRLRHRCPAWACAWCG